MIKRIIEIPSFWMLVLSFIGVVFLSYQLYVVVFNMTSSMVGSVLSVVVFLLIIGGGIMVGLRIGRG